MPKTLNSARPTPLVSINGYSSTPASCAESRIADGSRRAIQNTRAT